MVAENHKVWIGKVSVPAFNAQISHRRKLNIDFREVFHNFDQFEGVLRLFFPQQTEFVIGIDL